MKERNIKLIIAYDGTDFCGWQRQCAMHNSQCTINNEKCTIDERGNESPACCQQDQITNNNTVPCPLSPVPYTRTVQGVIENALAKMHKHPVNLTGAGRTDSGVHAAAQTANFYTDIQNIPSVKFVPALNSLLPRDVRILDAQEVPAKFHARFSAFSRTYRYQIILNRPALPHESRYNLQLWRSPDLSLLNSYGRLLLGETDCRIFAGSGDSALEPGKSANRYVHNAFFYIEKDRLIFEIKANAFLKNMVRSVAGTFLFYEEKKTSPSDLQKIIASGQRSLAGPTLPPHGLFLWMVEY